MEMKSRFDGPVCVRACVYGSLIHNCLSDKIDVISPVAIWEQNRLCQAIGYGLDTYSMHYGK